MKVVIDNNTIEPNTVTGDLKKISAGKGKKIEWDVLSDKTELKGKIKVIVEIAYTYSTKVTGGPSNLFLSMLLTGLGDINVDKERETGLKWYYITGLFIGTAYYAYYSKTLSNQYYDQYHSAIANRICYYQRLFCKNQMKLFGLFCFKV